MFSRKGLAVRGQFLPTLVQLGTVSVIVDCQYGSRPLQHLIKLIKSVNTLANLPVLTHDIKLEFSTKS